MDLNRRYTDPIKNLLARCLPELSWVAGLALALTCCSPETLVVGLEPMTLRQLDDPVQSVAFSPNGMLLAAGSADGTIRLWGVTSRRAAEWPLLFAGNISTGDELPTHSHDVAFSPDGAILAFGLPDGSVHLWALQASSGRPQRPSDYELFSLQALEGDDSPICSLDFSPDASAVAAGTKDGSVHLWRTTDGAHVHSLMGHGDAVVSLAFSPAGNALASASLDRTVKVWDLSTGAVTHELEHPWAMTAVAFSPDGAVLAVAGAADDTRQLLNTADWSIALTLESTAGGFADLAFSPNGRVLASGNASYQVLRWRAVDGRLVDAVEAHTDSVNSVAFSPDGKTLASASLDGTVKLWRLP